MDSLYGILPYSIDVVCAAINDFTDTPISVIRRKPFISYLNSYINHFLNVLQNKKIDRQFFLKESISTVHICSIILSIM